MVDFFAAFKGFKISPAIFARLSIWLFFIVIGLVILFFIINKKRLRWVVHIYELRGGGKKLKTYLARKYVTRDNMRGLLLQGVRDPELNFLPGPPSEAVNDTTSDFWGDRQEVTCYRTEEGEIIFQKSPVQKAEDLNKIDVDVHTINQDGEKVISKVPFAEEAGNLSSYERGVYLQNLRIIEQRKQHPRWKELLPLISLGFAVIIIALVFTFWGRINTTAANAMAQSVKMEELRLEQWEILRDMEYDVQVIKERVGVGNVTRPRTIPD